MCCCLGVGDVGGSGLTGILKSRLAVTMRTNLCEELVRLGGDGHLFHHEARGGMEKAGGTAHVDTAIKQDRWARVGRVGYVEDAQWAKIMVDWKILWNYQTFRACHLLGHATGLGVMHSPYHAMGWPESGCYHVMPLLSQAAC